MTIKVKFIPKTFHSSFTICPPRLSIEYNGKIKTHETCPHGPFLVLFGFCFLVKGTDFNQIVNRYTIIIGVRDIKEKSSLI